MNVKECIRNSVSEITTVEDYIITFRAAGVTEVIIPTGVNVKQIDDIIKPENVDFEYDKTMRSSCNNIGRYKYSKFFPVGSIVNVEGHECTITGYTVNGANIRNGMYSVDASVIFQDFAPDQRVSNPMIEDEVMFYLNMANTANENLKRILRDYNYDLITGMQTTDAMLDAELHDDILSVSSDNMSFYLNVLEDDYDSDLGAEQAKLDAMKLIRYNNSHMIKYKARTDKEYNALASEIVYYIICTKCGVEDTCKMETIRVGNGKMTVYRDTLTTLSGDRTNILVFDYPEYDNYMIAILDNWTTSTDTDLENVRARYAVVPKHPTEDDIGECDIYESSDGTEIIENVLVAMSLEPENFFMRMGELIVTLSAIDDEVLEITAATDGTKYLKHIATDKYITLE